MYIKVKFIPGVLERPCEWIAVGLAAALQAHVGDELYFYVISHEVVFYYSISYLIMGDTKVVSKRTCQIMHHGINFLVKAEKKLSGDGELEMTS